MRIKGWFDYVSAKQVKINLAFKEEEKYDRPETSTFYLGSGTGCSERNSAM